MRFVFAMLLAVASVAGAWPAHATTPAKKTSKKGKQQGPYGPSSRVERPAEVHGQASLRVRSIDFAKRVVVVEIGGFPKAPAGNLFTFTDDRGRKFIATTATCEAPFPSGIRVCDLTTPEGYERHPWVALELHLHGLTSGTVAAPKEEVERAFEAARALSDAAPLAGEDEAAEKETPPPSPRDGGEPAVRE